jgi:hypothetical protein
MGCFVSFGVHAAAAFAKVKRFGEDSEALWRLSGNS